MNFSILSSSYSIAQFRVMTASSLRLTQHFSLIVALLCFHAMAAETRPYKVTTQHVETPLSLRYVERQYLPGYSLLNDRNAAQGAVLTLRTAYRALKHRDAKTYRTLWVDAAAQTDTTDTTPWDKIVDVQLLREALRGADRIAVVECLMKGGTKARAAVTLIHRENDGRYLLSLGLTPSPAGDYLNAHYAVAKPGNTPACALPRPTP